ncbi:MAG: Mut7-C RNAse domain-containing protein, partial [Anaerolineae bacterium]
MSAPPAFIADAMLGKLARWLRLAGYDTIYDAALDDRELARRARESGRILLTRDRELAGRRGVRAYLVQSEQVQEQLEEVLRAAGAD